MSREKKNYLKKLRREKFLVFSSRLLILVLVLGVWEVLARYDVINTFTFSSPGRVINTLFGLIRNKSLFRHLWVTLYEVFISFGISLGIGFIVATILWSNKTLAKVFDPYLTVLNSLPKVALGPLIIIWVGASTNSIIFMSLLISSFITIINIYNGFSNVSDGYITLMKSFGANRKQTFMKVIFPSNLLTFVSSMKINISMNLIGVIMGELLVSKEGIGYLIMYGSQVFNIDLVITGVFILGIISYLMYYFIERVEIKIRNK